MNILGEGIKILLFAAPFAAVTVWAAMKVPDHVRIPVPDNIHFPKGYLIILLVQQNL